MNCKFCGAELEENASVCPSCGKDCTAENVDCGKDCAEEKMDCCAENAAEAETPAPEKVPEDEKKSVDVWKIVAITLGGILLLAVLTFAVLYGTGAFATSPTEATTVPGSSESVPPESKPSELGTAVRDKYTVSDEEAVAKKDTVIATMGDSKLTNSELQLWYWMGVYDFLNRSGGYGIDLSKPMYEQIKDAQTGDTWEQAFLDYALGTWARFVSICEIGQAQGVEISEEATKALEGLREQMEEVAKQNKFDSLEAMIQADMGPASDFNGYEAYMRMNVLSMEYFDAIHGSLTTTDEEIEKFFNDHEAEFAKNMITKTSGKLVDVRHILVSPEGGTKDEATNSIVYTDEEWEACRVKAQALLDEWMAGEKTEESFGLAAQKHSADPGSAAQGGLYTDVRKGDMVPEFDQWIFDESRQPGDTGLVKTKFGYHIMFFCGGEDVWYRQARIMLMSEKTQAILTEYMEAHPMDVDYDAIALGYVELMPAQPEPSQAASEG